MGDEAQTEQLHTDSPESNAPARGNAGGIAQQDTHSTEEALNREITGAETGGDGDSAASLPPPLTIEALEASLARGFERFEKALTQWGEQWQQTTMKSDENAAKESQSEKQPPQPPAPAAVIAENSPPKILSATERLKAKQQARRRIISLK